MFTERGLKRLALRAYRTYSNGAAPSRQAIWHPATGLKALPPIKGTPQERRARLRQNIAVGWRSYVVHPCALPNCPCIVHQLGLPQIEEVMAIMGDRFGR